MRWIRAATLDGRVQSLRNSSELDHVINDSAAHYACRAKHIIEEARSYIALLRAFDSRSLGDQLAQQVGKSLSLPLYILPFHAISFFSKYNSARVQTYDWLTPTLQFHTVLILLKRENSFLFFDLDESSN